MSPVAATFPLATRPPTGSDVRRSPTVGGAGLGARHSSDDVADRADVVVEVRARADDARALVTDLLQALRGHGLQRSTDDRKPVQ